MKVAFITPVFPTEDNPVSGIFINKIACYLQELDIEVIVIHPVPLVPFPSLLLPNDLKVIKNYKKYEIIEKGIKVFRPRYISYPKSMVWGFAHWFIYFAVNSVLKNLNPDIIHTHFVYPMGSVGYLLKRKYQIPHVTTIRGSDINIYPNISGFHRKRVRQALLRANCVTSVSMALAEKAHYISGVNPMIIYNGVAIDSNIGVLEKQIARKRHLLPFNKFIVLYVGSITKTKGIHELIEAFSSFELEKIQLIIIGGKINSYEKIDIPLKFTYIGNQSQQVVFEYMCAADLLVLPSYNEGMPNVIVEAGSLGLPVLSTSVGGIPELIDEDSGYLIETKSSDAIIKAILKIKDNYPQALQKADALKSIIRKGFDLSDNTRLLKDLYEKILSNNSDNKS